MMAHVYFGMENLNLNETQRQTLIDALKALGPASDPQPAKLNHSRVRPDGEAVIFEALFSEDALTIAAFKNRLAVIFDVEPDTINHATATQHFGGGDTPVVTFSRNGTDYIKVALFGGTDCTWQDSGDECRGYLALYSELWEPVE